MCNYFDSAFYTMAFANFVLIQGNCNKNPVNAGKCHGRGLYS